VLNKQMQLIYNDTHKVVFVKKDLNRGSYSEAMQPPDDSKGWQLIDVLGDYVGIISIWTKRR
jgi:hypothetical protein